MIFFMKTSEHQNAQFSLFTQHPCWLFCFCTALRCFEEGAETQVETQVVHLLSPLTITSPKHHPSGLNEAWRRSVAVWQAGLGWQGLPVSDMLSQRDLTSSFFLCFSVFFCFFFSSPYNQTGKGYLTLGAVESRHDLMRENCFTAKYPLFSDQAKNLTYVTKSSPIDIFSRHFGLMIIQIIPFDISLMTKKRRCTSLTPKICIIFLSSVTDCPCHLPLFQLTSRLRTNESIDLQLLVVFIL